MLNEWYLFVSTMLGAIPKEAYLLIGTILGAFVGTRGQLKLARVNHEAQYRLETQKLEHQQQVEMQKLEHQQQVEMQKLEHQERKERTIWLREKLEEAEKILLKIDMLNSLTGSDITREIGLSEAEWNAQYLKLDEEASRLQTMADLYFPELHRPVRELRGAMNVFWGAQRHLLYVDTEAFITDHLEYIEQNKLYKEQAQGSAWQAMCKITMEIGEKAGDVHFGLMQAARSLQESTERSRWAPR